MGQRVELLDLPGFKEKSGWNACRRYALVCACRGLALIINAPVWTFLCVNSRRHLPAPALRCLVYSRPSGRHRSLNRRRWQQQQRFQLQQEHFPAAAGAGAGAEYLCFQRRYDAVRRGLRVSTWAKTVSLLKTPTGSHRNGCPACLFCFFFFSPPSERNFLSDLT